MLAKVFLVIEVLWQARGIISAVVEAVESLNDPKVKDRIQVRAVQHGVERTLNKIVKIETR